MRIAQEHILVQYDPLDVAKTLEVYGGSLKQVYFPATGEYVPNRQLVPLTLMPKVSVIDPHNMMTEANLINHRWYENNVQIVNNSNYTINSDGSLVVKKNVDYLNPLELTYRGTLDDTRSSRAIEIELSVTLTTTESAGGGVVTKLDKSAAWTYNPLLLETEKTIKAMMYRTEVLLDDAEVEYEWLVVDNGTERAFTDMDLFYKSGQNTNTLVIDPRYIEKETIRCKTTTSKAGYEQESFSDTTIVRKFPILDYKIFQSSLYLRPEMEGIDVRLQVSTNKEVLTQLNRWWEIYWYGKRLMAGAEEHLLGYGEEINVPASVVGKDMYVQFQVNADIQEHGAKKALTVNGDILTVNGLILTT
jgi:hypothetical protein